MQFHLQTNIKIINLFLLNIQMNNGLLSTRKLLGTSSSVDYMYMYMASTVELRNCMTTALTLVAVGFSACL